MLAISLVGSRMGSGGDHAYPGALTYDLVSVRLLISHQDGVLTQVDLVRQELMHQTPVGAFGLTDLVMLPRRRACMGISGAEHIIYQVDVEQATSRHLAQFEELPSCLLPDPETDTVFVACLSPQQDLLYTLDAATGAVRNRAPIGRIAMALAVDHREHQLLVVNSGASTLPVIDTRTGDLLNTLNLPSRPVGLVVDEAGGQVFVATLRAGILVLRASDGSTLTHLPAETVYGAPWGRLPLLGGIALDATANRVILGYDQAQATKPPCAVTIIDSQTHAVVVRHQLPGIVKAVRVHGGKHRAYVLWQNRREGRKERELNLWVLDIRTGALLHEEVVARHPLDILLVEARNQLFIADFDLKAVVCVEDQIP